jgi:NAD(P)-dependent dehydrogenase (short-subunit alcohol dehydrogenase family)
MDLHLAGKVAVVTGASKGIGLARSAGHGGDVAVGRPARARTP